ncbi:MAG: hypothetical protein Q4A71_00980 [Actinomycetaceae bacterium]|nr:hypothetical protein [Actinomycetaceae bacterium]
MDVFVTATNTLQLDDAYWALSKQHSDMLALRSGLFTNTSTLATTLGRLRLACWGVSENTCPTGPLLAWVFNPNMPLKWWYSGKSHPLHAHRFIHRKSFPILRLHVGTLLPFSLALADLARLGSDEEFAEVAPSLYALGASKVTAFQHLHRSRLHIDERRRIRERLVTD